MSPVSKKKFKLSGEVTYRSKATGLPTDQVGTRMSAGRWVAMVKGEVASSLHHNTQVGPATDLCKGVSRSIVARDNITTSYAGETMMAKGIEHTPCTQGTHSTAIEVSRPSHQLTAT